MPDHNTSLVTKTPLFVTKVVTSHRVILFSSYCSSVFFFGVLCPDFTAQCLSGAIVSEGCPREASNWALAHVVLVVRTTSTNVRVDLNGLLCCLSPDSTHRSRLVLNLLFYVAVSHPVWISSLIWRV